MEDDRSKRLERLLESANEFEARQRRSNISSAVWGLLIVVMLVAMFFLGRAFYSSAPNTNSAKQVRSQPELSAESMTPDPIPVAQDGALKAAPTD